MGTIDVEISTSFAVSKKRREMDLNEKNISFKLRK
jgi:hypothetical protein